MNQSPRYHLDSADIGRIMVGALIAVGGALVVYASQTITQIDFGVATPFVVAGASVIINAVRKWLSGQKQ